jgi:outer membrane murein-binding lipoprotein Lpp
MADHAPLRTGRLVVRYHAPWRGRAIMIGAAIGLVLLLVGAFELGRYRSGYNKLAEMQHRRELSATIDRLEKENEELRQSIAASELAREVDRKAYADVEKNLADLQAQVLKHREELTFYRGIVSPEDGIGGLRIQRFQVLPGGGDQHYRLRLVLVQSMRQDAVVSGSVSIQIEGVQDSKPAELALSAARADGGGDANLPFRFRYFQNLEQDIVLPEGFEPRAINVEVRTAKLAPVRESYPWQVQVES